MKVKSSSVIEVVVAMVLFSIVVGLSTSLVFRYNGKKNGLKISARELLNKKLYESKSQNSLIDLSETSGVLEIQQEVDVYEDGLLKITLTALLGGKKIDELYEIVSVK